MTAKVLEEVRDPYSRDEIFEVCRKEKTTVQVTYESKP